MTELRQKENQNYNGLDKIHRLYEGGWEGLTRWAWVYLHVSVLLAAVTAGYSFTVGHYLTGVVFLSIPVVWLFVRYSAARPRVESKSTPVCSIDFSDENVLLIRDGDKRTTIRFDFDEDLQPGDLVQLTDEDGVTFAHARVVSHGSMSAEELVSAEFTGHRTYESVEELFDAMDDHYPEYDLSADPSQSFDVIFFTVIED